MFPILRISGFYFLNYQDPSFHISHAQDFGVLRFLHSEFQDFIFPMMRTHDFIFLIYRISGVHVFDTQDYRNLHFSWT